MNREKLEQLQFLRFICFTIVFIRHASVWVHFPNPKGNVVNVITFFLMLSGFMTAYTMFEREPKLDIKNIFIYVFKKIRKFYPIYIVTLLISILLSDSKISVLQSVRNIFMIQSWFGEGYFMYNGATWYLSTLMFLYLISIPVLRILRSINESQHRERTKKLIYVSVIVAAFLCAVVYCYFMSVELIGKGKISGSDEFWLYIFPPARIAEYVAGMCMAYLYCINKERSKDYNKKVFTVLEAVVLIGWVTVMAFPVSGWQFRIVRWFIPNVLLIAVFSVGRGSVSDILRNKVLVTLGNISFEAYMIHMIIIELVDILNEKFGQGIKIPDIIIFIFSYALTVGIAKLISGKKDK